MTGARAMIHPKTVQEALRRFSGCLTRPEGSPVKLQWLSGRLQRVLFGVLRLRRRAAQWP